MSNSYVRIDGTKVFVLQNAHAKNIVVPEDALARREPVRSFVQCEEGKSRCLGGLEYCCNLDVKGNCDGRWDDC